MIGPISRILLRVAAGALISKGYFAPEDANAITSDPDLVWVVEMALGGAVWGVTELWYSAARKFGWAK